MTDEHLERLKQFAAKVPLLKHEAGELGLFKTLQALEVAVTAVGWEIAEQIEKPERAE